MIGFTTRWLEATVENLNYLCAPKELLVVGKEKDALHGDWLILARVQDAGFHMLEEAKSWAISAKHRFRKLKWVGLRIKSVSGCEHLNQFTCLQNIRMWEVRPRG